MKSLFCYGVLMAMLLTGCETGLSPQQQLLDRAAAALEKKNPADFLNCLDLDAYSRNQVKNLTSNDSVLNTLDKLGSQIGLGSGSLDNLIGSVMDIEGKIRQEFSAGVASGQIMAQCARSISPDCPWSPAALKNAKIVNIGQEAAVAQVTTPSNITSWLALRKMEDGWKIVGRAPLEATARQFAVPQQIPAPKPNDGKAS